MDAVILAGGLSRRLGGVSKAGLLLEGKTLLARTVDSAAQIIARAAAQPAEAGRGAGTRARIAVVGPVEKTRAWLADAKNGAEVVFAQEVPPYSGPAAGIAAGMTALAAQPSGDGDSETVLVLACDMPRAGEVAALLMKALEEDGASHGVMAVDNGRQQPLAAIYPLAALRLAVDAARRANRLQNASVFSLLANVNIIECVVPLGLAADIDTWQDARAEGIDAGPAEVKGQ